MEFLDQAETFRVVCKAEKKWGISLSIYTPDGKILEIEKAAPYLKDAPLQFLIENGGVVLCSSEEEMNTLYNQTVGDEGPTKTNSYEGPVRIYALTCSPEGRLMNENT